MEKWGVKDVMRKYKSTKKTLLYKIKGRVKENTYKILIKEHE